MRSTRRAALLIGAAVLLIQAAPVRAQYEGEVAEDSEHLTHRTRAARLRPSDVSDPDTVYIGHVVGNTGLPGVPGGYGPYHIGRGLRRVGSAGTAADRSGYWDFDTFVAGEVDSLQGWWPVARPYQSVGSSNLADQNRPFFGFDYGNQGNYAIDQGSPKRTFGVVGYWHRDPGNAVGQNVTWTPIAGTASAWCGLRNHGDLSVVEAIANGGTGNPINSDVLDFQGNNNSGQFGAALVTGTDHDFPGYGSQWDQMLYRDIVLADGANLNLSFRYSTTMSKGAITTSSIRIGWFDKDPLKATHDVFGGASNDDNFISSTGAGALAPIDSFMVYVGAPVEPVAGTNNDFTASDGTRLEIHDVKRRWFSEVLDISNPGTTYREILSTSGVNPRNALNGNDTTYSASIPNSFIQPILNLDGTSNGGKVRVVFRVKTNRGSSDEDAGSPIGFNSGTKGAAIVDEVLLNGWAAANGNFESTGSINNDPAVAADAAWKSTGKPPAIYFHTHDLSAGLSYDDPCGLPGSPDRQCNMTGRLLSAGDHDQGERPGGVYGANDQERETIVVMPAINLKSNGAGQYNGMGIDAEIANATEDYYVAYDRYGGGTKGSSVNGNFFRVGWQSYPATQPNGVKCWGEVMFPSGVSYNPLSTCFDYALAFGAKSGNLLVTSNPNGIPDSMRVYIEQLSRCFITSLSASECSPATGYNSGIYFDNVSFAFVDGAPPASIAVPIWMWFQDAFPATGNVALVGTPSFDTTTAAIRTGYNIAQGSSNLYRHNVPGDSVAFSAAGTNKRIDMVFRILPGVGNYLQVGNRATPLRKRPDGGAGAGNAAAPGDGSFWGEYMADNGAFGTGGNGSAGPGHGGVWDPHRWNSARCDTLERNLFPVNANSGTLTLSAGSWQTTYHESDPRVAKLGIVKNRCFLIDAVGQVAANNTTCGSGTYPPLWATPAAGFNANEIPAQPGRTREFTQIIPDGQLTPGAHVEYFFRKSDDVGNVLSSYSLYPDTMYLFSERFDAHRWQEFSVLPDRWKDPAFQAGGHGMACLLWVDANDGRGDEHAWVSIADSIGATAPNKYGAHNGWHARGDQDITVSLATVQGTPGDWGVYAHLGQPGTIWDMFGCRASEAQTTGAGALGSRTAYRDASLTQGKDCTSGPSGDMLRQYYKALVYDSGDLTSGFLGPYVDKTDNDVGLLQDFVNQQIGSPRFLWAMGRGFVESQAIAHPGFTDITFGATLSSNFYQQSSANRNPYPDLVPVPPVVTNGAIYGVLNFCTIDNDALLTNTAVPLAQAASYYENAGGAYIAGVYTPPNMSAGGSHVAYTLVDGFRITSLGSRHTLTSGGARQYFLQVLTNVFGALNCGAALGTPTAIGDGPSSGSTFVNFMDLRSPNPVRGEARIAFGLARTENVEVRVFDVGGRQVRQVANRVFPGAREQVVTWDGTDDHGRTVAPGVYFYQLRSPSFVSRKKLIVLKQ